MCATYVETGCQVEMGVVPTTAWMRGSGKHRNTSRLSGHPKRGCCCLKIIWRWCLKPSGSTHCRPPLASLQRCCSQHRQAAEGALQMLRPLLLLWVEQQKTRTGCCCC